MYLRTLALVAAIAMPVAAPAATYDIDPTHTFIEFKASHLGFGWVVGRFNRFEGEFVFDPDAGPEAQSARVSVETGSLDSNHSERDEHLTNDDFLDAEKHPVATFVSTGFAGDASGGVLSGTMNLWGTDVPVDIKVTPGGAGQDPWGGERAGFHGQVTLDLGEFGFSSRVVSEVELDLYVEGVKR